MTVTLDCRRVTRFRARSTSHDAQRPSAGQCWREEQISSGQTVITLILSSRHKSRHAYIAMLTLSSVLTAWAPL